jgi:hypothetical protein
MVAERIKPRTPEESLIYWAIVGTWGLWLLGALYHALPLLAYVLAGIGLYRRVTRGAAPLPIGVYAWCAGMAVIYAVLVAGHGDFELGFGQLFKSTFGWAKGWLLFALLPFAGASLLVRPRLIYRAVSVLGIQTLILSFVFVAAGVVGLPGRLYVSPLVYAGGGDNSFFEVGPYLRDTGWLGFRLRYFAPWSPAAALIGCLLFVLAARERNRLWSWIGMAAGFLMCLLSLSRLGVIAIPLLALAVPVLVRFDRPATWAAASALAIIAFIGWEAVSLIASDLVDAFKSARADSSRVRSALQNIALHRWLNDAPIWGHGVVERGSHHVEYMMIGSHHTWFSLLFVKGIVGALAFAIPLAWTLVEMVVKGRTDGVARAALGVVLVLILFSFGENLEVLAYLVWPGIFLIGMAMRRPLRPRAEEEASADVPYGAAQPA